MCCKKILKERMKTSFENKLHFTERHEQRMTTNRKNSSYELSLSFSILHVPTIFSPQSSWEFRKWQQHGCTPSLQCTLVNWSGFLPCLVWAPALFRKAVGQLEAYPANGQDGETIFSALDCCISVQSCHTHSCMERLQYNMWRGVPALRK